MLLRAAWGPLPLCRVSAVGLPAVASRGPSAVFPRSRGECELIPHLLFQMSPTRSSVSVRDKR